MFASSSRDLLEPLFHYIRKNLKINISQKNLYDLLKPDKMLYGSLSVDGLKEFQEQIHHTAKDIRERLEKAQNDSSTSNTNQNNSGKLKEYEEVLETLSRVTDLLNQELKKQEQINVATGTGQTMDMNSPKDLLDEFLQGITFSFDAEGNGMVRACPSLLLKNYAKVTSKQKEVCLIALQYQYSHLEMLLEMALKGNATVSRDTLSKFRLELERIWTSLQGLMNESNAQHTTEIVQLKQKTDQIAELFYRLEHKLHPEFVHIIDSFCQSSVSDTGISRPIQIGACLFNLNNKTEEFQQAIKILEILEKALAKARENPLFITSEQGLSQILQYIESYEATLKTIQEEIDMAKANSSRNVESSTLIENEKTLKSRQTSINYVHKKIKEHLSQIRERLQYNPAYSLAREIQKVIKTYNSIHSSSTLSK